MTIKTVYIEITNRCNLNCRTCYNSSGLNRHTKEISLKDIKKTITIFSQYGAKRFLFSGGEPSLHSEFHKIFELIEQHPQYAFGFVTNGTNNDADWISFLNTHNNITLQISLDGATEEQNSFTRGNGNFAKALEFAKRIHNPHLKKLLKMVVSQKNLNGVEDFYKLARSLDFTPEFAFIYRSGNAEDDWERKHLTAKQKISILQIVHQLNQKYNHDAHLPRCTTTCPFTSNTDNMSICIKTDGSIQPCQSLYASDFTIGNLFNFDEKIMLQKLKHITDLAKERAHTDFECKKCMLKNTCGKGCMAEAYNLTASPLGNDGNCLYRKLELLNFEIKKQQDVF